VAVTLAAALADRDETEVSTSRRTAQGGFRADLEGVRGVAVLLVVAFHAEVAGFGGGFVGVDVFFVLSGWLITRQLLDEAGGSGTVRLREFWARRMRRLAPALALVVVATLAAAVLILDPLEWARAARDGAAAGTYTANLVFANDASGYFAPQSESLFLHTWSLGVEEQFYLAWPLGLLGLAALTRRRPQLFRSAALAAFVGVGVISLAAAVVLTRQGTPWSFFGLPTRAWEFAAAGVVAAAAGPMTARLRLGWLGWLGLVTILWTGTRFDSTTPYPGLPTVLPVAATVAIILAGEAAGGPASVLSTRPLRWLGRLSYSWYLWHWPAILLAVEVVHSDSTAVRCIGAVVALGLAAATHRLVENPVRFSPTLQANRWLTFGLAGGATVVILVAAFGLQAHADREIAGDPLLHRLQVARDEVDDVVPCTGRAVTPEGDGYCIHGDIAAPQRVLLVGDSHAEQWIPGLSAAADQLPVRLSAFARGGCPPVDVRIAVSESNLVAAPACLDHRAALERVVDAEQPDLVVVAVTDFIGRIVEADGHRPTAARQRQMFVDALDGLVDELQARGTDVVLILENPKFPEDPITCVARSRSIPACTPDAATFLAPVAWLVEAERRITRDHDLARPYDTVGALCPGTTCRVDDGATFFYGDANHLSPRYTASQADALAAWLTESLRGSVTSAGRK
jgi:peptidoglycan/LPS O-acetylase OafA/YrhL